METKDGMLLGHLFTSIFLGTDVKGELSILDNNSRQGDTADASTSHDGQQCAVEISTGEHGSSNRRRDVGVLGLSIGGLKTKNLAHVGAPHGVQGLVEGIFLLILGDVVDVQLTFLSGRQRTRFFGAAGGKSPLLADMATGVSRVGGWIWGGGAEEKGLLGDFIAEDLGRGGGVVGAREEDGSRMLFGRGVGGRHDGEYCHIVVGG